MQIERDCLYLIWRTDTGRFVLLRMKWQTLVSKWNKDYSFEFVPVLNMEPEGSNWNGATGLVTDYLKSAYVDTGKIALMRGSGLFVWSSAND